MKRVSIAILLLAAFILSGCSTKSSFASNSQPASPTNEPEKTASAASGSYQNMSVSDLRTELDNKNFTLINVHVPHNSDIPKTDLAIPYDQIDQNLNQLPSDKGAKIVLYCSSGHMSGIAAEKLASQGYTNVWSLEGGMSAWQKAGLPLNRK